uniref:zyxin n=1 Tax=Callospermophilus lateralis TaxID=76772 RepID=UPI00403856D9
MSEIRGQTFTWILPSHLDSAARTLPPATPGPAMAAPRPPPAISVSVSAPAFYAPQKKFGPVVAPKPKVNPFRPGDSEPPAAAGAQRAQMGRVGEIPPPPPEDFPLPPPPVLGDGDDAEGALGGAFPPPPPPIEEPFPPAPLEEDIFPSPPPPLEMEGAPEAPTPLPPQPREKVSSIDLEIDSLSSLLDDMTKNDPFKARVSSGYVPPPVATPFIPKSSAKPALGAQHPCLLGRKQARARSSLEEGGQRAGLGRSLEEVTLENVKKVLGFQVRSPGAPGPLTLKEVEELEQLTQQLMQDMEQPQRQSVTVNESCGKCQQPLDRSQPAVRALGQLFHIICFTCHKCEQQLQGQQFYSLEGVPYCEDCYTDTLEKCNTCGQPITERMLRATGKAYHPQCFTCVVCACPLEGTSFIVDQANRPHCVPDYHKQYAPKCSVCSEPIMPEPGRDETVRVVALDKNFHMKCYKCEDCGKPLSVEADDDGCFPLDGHVLCRKCHAAKAQT